MTQSDRTLERSFQNLEPKAQPNPSGWLGYTIRGVFRINVPREPSRLYVRFADGRFVKAINDAQIYVDDDIEYSVIPVDLEQDDRSEWHIKRISSAERDAILGKIPNVNLKPHRHDAGEIDYIPDEPTDWETVPETLQEAVDFLAAKPIPPQLVPLTYDGAIVVFNGAVVMVRGDV